MRLLNWIKRLLNIKGKQSEKVAVASNKNTDPYSWAVSQLGVKEIWGKGSNKQIEKYLAAAGLDGYHDETAWCAAFVNWCLVQAGMYGTGKANARSFLKYGKEAKAPEQGDIVVFWRGSKQSWQGHVGFFKEFTAHGHVVCLGGNQGDKVCFKTYPIDKVLGFRKVV